MGQSRAATPPIANTPYFYTNAGTVGFAWPNSNGTTAGSVVTGTVLSGNVWHYVVCTHDGTTGKVYVNGVLVGSVVGTLYSVPAAQYFLCAVPAFSFGAGSVDEFSLQAGAISASDVALEYSLATAIGTVYDDNAITFAADSSVSPSRTIIIPSTRAFDAAALLGAEPSLSTVRAFDLPASAAAAFINSLDAAQSISFPAVAGLSFSATSIIDATLALDAGAGLDPTRGISLEAVASMVVDTALDLTSQGTFNVLVALQAAAAFDTSNTATLNKAFTLLASAAFAASALLSAQSSLTLEALAALAFIGTGPPLENQLTYEAFASADFGLIYRPGGWLEVDPSSGNWTMPPQALSSWTERSAGQANWVKP